VEDATEHLRRLARLIVDTTLERVPLRAAILLGLNHRLEVEDEPTPVGCVVLTTFAIACPLPPERARWDVAASSSNSSSAVDAEPGDYDRAPRTWQASR
jgi:hypothetical protein